VKLTLATLKRYLRYDKRTGEWRWLCSPNGRIAAGSQAGTAKKDFYRQITLFGRTYQSSQLAWFYVKGSWAKSHIDHKDGKIRNDRFSNLRKATRDQNISNSKMRKDNTSGYKGVYKTHTLGKWQACIGHKNERIYLGLFTSPQAAHQAYCQAAKKLKREFARFQ
jgi:hypothetical protein